MPAKALAEPVGAPTRQRADCGRYVRLTHAERLQGLRKRCAGSENIETLKRVLGEASELASVAPEHLLGDIGDFTDRVHEKIDRLAPATVPKAVSVKPPPHRVGFNAQGFSTISMRISEWTVDEYGNRSRVAWNRADGMSPPSPTPP